MTTLTLKKACEEKALIVYEDETSFRQTPTLHQTWALRNSQPVIPTRGQRNTQKNFCAVCLPTAAFAYRHQEDYFNASSYLEFLEHTLMPYFYKKGRRIYLIQDTASYHKKPEIYEWFADHRKHIEVFQLPPYLKML